MGTRPFPVVGHLPLSRAVPTAWHAQSPLPIGGTTEPTDRGGPGTGRKRAPFRGHLALDAEGIACDPVGGPPGLAVTPLPCHPGRVDRLPVLVRSRSRFGERQNRPAPIAHSMAIGTNNALCATKKACIPAATRQCRVGGWPAPVPVSSLAFLGSLAALTTTVSAPGNPDAWPISGPSPRQEGPPW